MTLAVAITVPSQQLNPQRRPLVFAEPGVAFATDSRFTFSEGDPFDAGRKIWAIGESALGAFAGDVEICEVALASTMLAAEDNGWTDHLSLVTALGAWLSYFRGRLPSGNRAIYPSTVLLGSAGERRGVLSVLESSESFRPTPWSGIKAIGTGAETFSGVIEEEVDFQTARWAEPYRRRNDLGVVERGEDGEITLVPVDENYPEPVSLLQVGGLAVMAADSAVERAAYPTVGGRLQAFTLGPSGIMSVGASKSSRGGPWEHLVENATTTLAGYWGRKVNVPRMRPDFTIDRSP